MTNWARDYVGLPFLDRGRDRDGLDCWGLVRLVLAEQQQIEVPAFAGISADDGYTVNRAVVLEAAQRATWTPVDVNDAQAFDVVLMRGRMSHEGRSGIGEVHVGIMADSKTLLHIEQGKNAVLVGLKNPTVNHRITRMFRHRETCLSR